MIDGVSAVVESSRHFSFWRVTEYGVWIEVLTHNCGFIFKTPQVSLSSVSPWPCDTVPTPLSDSSSKPSLSFTEHSLEAEPHGVLCCRFNWWNTLASPDELKTELCKFPSESWKWTLFCLFCNISFCSEEEYWFSAPWEESLASMLLKILGKSACWLPCEENSGRSCWKDCSDPIRNQLIIIICCKTFDRDSLSQLLRTLQIIKSGYLKF